MQPEEDERWQRLVAVLQEEIEASFRALYSARVLEQVDNPHRMGRMDQADAQATVTGWCGDTMAFYLKLNCNTIQEARFTTDGCGPTVASGNMLATMVQGMALAEANGLSAPDLLEALDGLPEESAHCADLAVNTLRQALATVLPQDATGAG